MSCRARRMRQEVVYLLSFCFFLMPCLMPRAMRVALVPAHEAHRGRVFFFARTPNSGRVESSQEQSASTKNLHKIQSVFPKKSFFCDFFLFFFFRAKTSSASDDGETSSASEDSAESYSAAATASYKRPAESSGCFRLPPSQRLRTTSSSPLLQHPGWLPVSSGGTFNTGNPNPAAAAGRQQQRQLPRLAALETLMSSHNNQQYQQPPEQDQHPHRRSPTLRFHQQQPHHHRQDFPLGPHAPTTRLVSRTNATVQLPSLSREMKSSGGSSVGSRPSSSASSSPTCSPGLRSASPPFGGRYELPPPACTQGGASAAAGLPSAGGGSVDVNQRWLVGAAGTNTHTRRQVPRIDALSPTKNAPGASAAAFQARQPWHNATAAPEAAAAGGSAARAAANGTAGRWPEHEGEGRRGVIGHSHASGAASASYAREVGEDRSNVAWARQHGAGAAWPLQQHREHHQQVRLSFFFF